MSRLKVDLQLNASGYTQGMEEAKKVTKEYTNEVARIRETLPNAQQEYRRVLKDVNNLTLAIQRMTKAERDSAEGRAMTKMLQDAKVRAAELNDMIGDTRQEIKNMASDTRNIDAMGDAFALVGNTLSGVAGAMGLATGKQEDLNKAIAAFTTVQSITNAVTKVGNILQKQSSLMNVITIAQEKMKTAAVNLETSAKSKNIIVTKAATAAQIALNSAADANPYVLLASALVAIGVSLYAYIKYTGDATKAEEEMTQKAEEAKEKMEEYKKEMLNTANNVVVPLYSSYLKLQAAWNELNTEAQKTEFIKKYANEMKNLGVEIRSVHDAENLFVKNQEAFVRSIELRARAAVLMKRLEKQLEDSSMTNGAVGGQPDKTQIGNGQYTIGEFAAKNTAQELAKTQAEIDSMLKQFGGSVGKPTVNKPTISKPDKEDEKVIEGTIKWYEQQIDKMAKELEDITALNIDGTININWVNKKNELDKAKNQLKELNDQLEAATVEGQKKANEERKKKTEKLEEQYYKSLHAEEEYYKGKEQDKKDEEVKKINDRAEAWSYYGDMVQGVGAAMSKFMDEDSAAMVQWVANSAAMVAQTISQIMAMQASAMAKATDSGASLPFPANIAAIAAGVSAVLSIFASLPAFAEGGVVSGPYSSGDRMLARVNAGERILTAEQNETFNELSKNMGGSTSVAVRLDVSKIRGGDMYLAIKNYMKENNKTW